MFIPFSILGSASEGLQAGFDACETRTSISIVWKGTDIGNLLDAWVFRRWPTVTHIIP